MPTEQHEKSPLQSKKFLAFVFAEFGFFVLMGMMLYLQEIDKVASNLAFMVLAVTAGFLAVAYIGGQALVDRYIRVALITMGKDVPEPEPEQPPEGDS